MPQSSGMEKISPRHRYIFDISISFLRGVFKYLSFSPLVGEMIQFDSYDPEWVAQPPRYCWWLRKSQTITWDVFYTGCKPMGYILDCPPLPGFQWQNEGSGRDPLLENLRILVGDLLEKKPSHLREENKCPPLWSCRPQVDCPNGMWVAWPLRRRFWGLIGSFFFLFWGGEGMMKDGRFYHVFFWN